MADALVLGGSRGIGRAIADALKSAGVSVTAASRGDVDTSDPASVMEFAKRYGSTDILVLNTGGPPPQRFEEVTDGDWHRYHNQLFLGFCTILREVEVRDGGYIFLISSGVVREPIPNLVVSSAYRAAFSEVFKVQSKEYAKRGVSCISIAPGPFDTDRTRELVQDVEALKKSLPMGRLGRPEEIGSLVGSIVQHEIKYLSGTVITVDGASSAHVF